MYLYLSIRMRVCLLVCESQSSIKLFRLLFLATLSICLKRKLLWKATKTPERRETGRASAIPLYGHAHAFMPLGGHHSPNVEQLKPCNPATLQPCYLPASHPSTPPPSLVGTTLLLFLTLLQLRIVFVGIFQFFSRFCLWFFFSFSFAANGPPVKGGFQLRVYRTATLFS